jgi:HK97 family phage major capsid protein
MSDTDATVAAEAKTAAAEFLAGFRTFRDETTRRIAEMGTRIETIDRKSVELRRPALSTAAEFKAPHAKAMAAYLRRGDDEPLRSLDIETKALNTQVSAEGGFLVDPKTSEMIGTILRSGGSLRSLARVVQVEAGVYDVLVDHTDLGAGWADELAVTSETEAPIVDRISITLHELSAAPTASQRILDDAAFDVEAWLAERIADRFLRAEASAFVSGNGVGKPKGFLTKPAIENGSWAWGSIGYIATGSSGDFDPNDPADALIETVYALPSQYRAGAAFVMNSKTAGEVRKMKDAQGRFLWAEGLHAAQPALLCGYPVLVAEDMPDIEPDAHAIAFGNFDKGYTIAERPDLRVLRDPYSAKPNVMFYATKRVGGDVTDYAAIKTLKFASS